MRKTGRRILEVGLDVTDKSSIKDGIKTVYRELGGIDILVNNAGVNIRKPSLDIDWDECKMVLNTNLKGTFFVSQAIVPVICDNEVQRLKDF